MTRLLAAFSRSLRLRSDDTIPGYEIGPPESIGFSPAARSMALIFGRFVVHHLAKIRHVFHKL